MSRLAEDDLLTLSREAGLPAPAVRRLLGSLKVGSVSGGAVKFYDLGLRIPPDLLGGTATGDLVVILSQYAALCPNAVGWVARGDFDPRKIPEGLGTAKLLHACRTAGRLRAEFLRMRS